MPTIKKNEAYVLLKYKIKENIESIDDLGLLSQEEIRTKILNKKFRKSETSVTIAKAVNKGLLSVYYSEFCSFCDFQNLFQEESPKTFETESKLQKNGFECKNCGKEKDIEGSLNKLFCVNHEYMTPNESSEAKTLFDKIKELFPWTQ